MILLWAYPLFIVRLKRHFWTTSCMKRCFFARNNSWWTVMTHSLPLHCMYAVWFSVCLLFLSVSWEQAAFWSLPHPRDDAQENGSSTSSQFVQQPSKGKPTSTARVPAHPFWMLIFQIHLLAKPSKLERKEASYRIIPFSNILTICFGHWKPINQLNPFSGKIMKATSIAIRGLILFFYGLLIPSWQQQTHFLPVQLNFCSAKHVN